MMIKHSKFSDVPLSNMANLTQLRRIPTEVLILIIKNYADHKIRLGINDFIIFYAIKFLNSLTNI